LQRLAPRRRWARRLLRGRVRLLRGASPKAPQRGGWPSRRGATARAAIQRARQPGSPRALASRASGARDGVQRISRCDLEEGWNDRQGARRVIDEPEPAGTTEMEPSARQSEVKGRNRTEV